MSLENAAAAFDVAMGNSTAPSKASKGNDEGPVEAMFENPGEQYGDDEAGGDDIPAPKVRRQADPENDDAGGDDEDLSEEELEALRNSPDEDDEEEDEKGDDQGELDLEAKVVVKVDGEEQEVSLKDALDGYIRTETFHRRLNQLHDAAKVVEQEAVKVSESRTRYADLLQTLTEQLDLLSPKEPDWSKLAAEDPQAAFQQKLQWDRFKEQRAALDAEKKRVEEEKNSEATESLKKYVVAERQKMLTTVPEWNDPKIRERDQRGMTALAKSLGFSDDEVSTVYDHRMMRVLLMASKYQRLMQRAPKPTTGHSKLTKQGTGASRTVPRAEVGAQKRLARTGSIEAAAEVFGGILQSETRASRKR